MPPVDSRDRKKRYHQKDINGCASCKQKHTRCDLRRPSCYKCILADRECLYDTPRSQTQPQARTSQLIHLYNGVRNEIRDPREQRAMAYFMDRTRKELGGFTSFTEQFWNILIPHLSITEPTIRHLAIAVATRHELTRGQCDNAEELYDFCSQQHCLSLELLSRLDAERHADLLLLSCIAFIAFERITDFTGMEARYLPYVLAGLKILRERRAAFPYPNAVPSSNLIDSFISPMMLQIELMFSIFCTPTRVLGSEQEWAEAEKPTVPDRFADLKQARNLFSQICTWRFHPSIASQPWTKQSTAFHEICSLVSKWQHIFTLFVAECQQTSEELGDKADALRQQTCVLTGAILYSVEDAVSIGACCYPTLVDLRITKKMHLYIRIPANRRINLTAINGGKLCNAADTDVRILPRAKRIQGDGVDDSVLLEFNR